MNRRTATTILLLDGRDDCRAQHAKALRETGLHVTAVGDSQAALAAIATIQPGAIVANMDGQVRDDRLNFCRQSKGEPRTEGIPVMLTTEGLLDQDVDLATDPGVLVLTMAANDVSKLLGRSMVSWRPCAPSHSLHRSVDEEM